jgi:hypothetical protein
VTGNDGVDAHAHLTGRQLFSIWRDLAMLLLVFPDLKSESSLVADCLRAAGAGPEVLAVWGHLAASEIRAANEDDEF